MQFLLPVETGKGIQTDSFFEPSDGIATLLTP